jgi:hypothetical protein
MFSIRGVSPGEYSALAWEDIEPGAAENRAFVERYEQRALKVHVGRGDAKSVSLRAIAPD